MFAYSVCVRILYVSKSLDGGGFGWMNEWMDYRDMSREYLSEVVPPDDILSRVHGDV